MRSPALDPKQAVSPRPIPGALERNAAVASTFADAASDPAPARDDVDARAIATIRLLAADAVEAARCGTRIIQAPVPRSARQTRTGHSENTQE